MVHDCFGTTIDHVETMQRELLDQWALPIDHLKEHQRLSLAPLRLRCLLHDRGDAGANKLGSNPYLFS